jgi:hypothetical protein
MRFVRLAQYLTRLRKMIRSGEERLEIYQMENMQGQATRGPLFQDIFSRMLDMRLYRGGVCMSDCRPCQSGADATLRLVKVTRPSELFLNANISPGAAIHSPKSQSDMALAAGGTLRDIVAKGSEAQDSLP